VIRLLVAVALVALPLSAWADDDSDRVSPDRAGASVSATTVGRGVTQLETGLQYTHESIGGSPAQRRFAVQLAVRGGLTDRFELAIEGEPLVSLHGADDATNIGVLGLNAKWVFFDSPEGSAWPTLGLQPVVKLPVANQPIDSGKFAFGLVLLASFDLPAAFNLDFNAGVGGRGQSSGGYLAQAQAALGLSRDVTRTLQWFTDLSFASREERHARSSLGLDAGVVWWPTLDVAVDTSFVTSLVGQGPDWGFRSGVSVRFGHH
jgi:Putative MetA-pathway of phenol degradation